MKEALLYYFSAILKEYVYNISYYNDFFEVQIICREGVVNAQ